jgi:hypothetical protein
MNSAEYLKRLREQQAAIERHMLERERAGLATVGRAVRAIRASPLSPPVRRSRRPLILVSLLLISAGLFSLAVALLLREISADTVAHRPREERAVADRPREERPAADRAREEQPTAHRPREERPAAAVGGQQPAIGVGADMKIGPQPERLPATTLAGRPLPPTAAGRGSSARQDPRRAPTPRPTELFPGRSESIAITQSP